MTRRRKRGHGGRPETTGSSKTKRVSFALSKASLNLLNTAAVGKGHSAGIEAKQIVENALNPRLTDDRLALVLLERLFEAAQHLSMFHSCDCPGHQQWEEARDEAARLLAPPPPAHRSPPVGTQP